MKTRAAARTILDVAALFLIVPFTAALLLLRRPDTPSSDNSVRPRA